MIALNERTAILFDAVNKTARLISYSDDTDEQLKLLYKFIGCDLVDIIRLDRDHVIFVDDEGLWKNNRVGFRIGYNGRNVTFVGSGILTGDTPDGSCGPIKLNFPDLKIEVVVYENPEEED
jgi:hypothetical protein